MDSSIEDEGCDSVVGGGCLGAPPSPCAEDEHEAETATTGDTGCPECGWVGGGGQGGSCATAPMPSASILLVFLLFVARSAFAVDVQHLQWLDGGPLPGVVDATEGEPWTARGAIGVSQAADPVRLRTSDDAIRPLVEGIATVEAAASLQVKDWFRTGVSLPLHSVLVAGQDEADVGVGYLSPFLVAPMGPRTAMSVVADLPRRSTPTLVGQTSLAFGLSGTRALGPVDLAGQIRARLQEKQLLPGVVWGQRLELQAGLRSRGRFTGGGQLVIGAPLDLVLTSRAGTWPVEAHAVGGARLVHGVHLDVGGGPGATYGLGSPTWRVFAGLRFEGSRGDLDGDGIGNLVDLCPSKPEDRDGFRDRDGCPELDNDKDGFADAADACPLDAEVVNGLHDDDGCPDALAEWRVVVASDGALEQVRIAVDGEGDWGLSEQGLWELPPGEHHLRVEAPGHRDFDAVLMVPEGRSTTEVRLHVERYGEVHVVLVSEDDQRVAGQVQLGEVEVDVAVEGTSLTLPAGTARGTASAPGHLPEAFTLRVPVGAQEPAEIRLERRPEQAEKPPVLFALDSAQLTDASVELLDALAQWMVDHADVRLLRIEGHASEIGSPAYNHALSLRRAESVRTALVDRGIDRERLDVLGSGEARAQLVPDVLPPAFRANVAGTPAREVTFHVVVWNDAVALE